MGSKSIAAYFAAHVSPEDERMGALAYQGYRDTMRAFAEHYGFGLQEVTEAFVALSPNNDYHGNLRSLASVLHSARADGLMEDVNISTYRACGLRAYSYVTGEVDFLSTVKGPKITAFRDNILRPKASEAVTIDGHMICIWVGKDMTMAQAARHMKSARMYGIIEGDFQRLAHDFDWVPNVLQATLWFARKRVLGIKFDTQMELFSQHGTRWVGREDPRDYPPYLRS